MMSEGPLDDMYTSLEEIGMGDVEFPHAQVANHALAVRNVYFLDGGFWAARLRRDREYTERVAAHALPGEGNAYVLLVRSGSKDEGEGRTFLVTDHAGLVEDLPRLIQDHGFELAEVRSDWLLEDLPDEYAASLD